MNIFKGVIDSAIKAGIEEGVKRAFRPKRSERLYWFVQRHYWTNRVLDPVRWWLERRGL